MLLVCQLVRNIQLIVYETVPLIDTDNAHAQSHRQQREISLDDDTSPAENDSASVHQHASRATADWNKYVQKGQELINNLENALKNKKAIDSKFNIFRGWKPSNKKPETLPSVVGSAMDSDGIPTVQSQHYKYWEAKDPQSPSQYSGFFESGSNPKAMVEKRISKNGNPSLQISEVAFQLASWALDDGEESLQKLEYIYKPEIQNPLTVDIMKQAYANTCDKGDRIVFKPDSEEFKALLGSPNGALVPRMLIDHADFFGKTVKEIRLYLEKDMMVFKLG